MASRSWRSNPERPDAAKAGCGAASRAGWVGGREVGELPHLFGVRVQVSVLRAQDVVSS